MCSERCQQAPYWAGLMLLLLLLGPGVAIGEGANPSPEFLEFLGEFSEADDSWVDPTLLPPVDEHDDDKDNAPDRGEEEGDEG